jgi:hypothetical protein
VLPNVLQTRAATTPHIYTHGERETFTSAHGRKGQKRTQSQTKSQTHSQLFIHGPHAAARRVQDIERHRDREETHGPQTHSATHIDTQRNAGKIHTPDTHARAQQHTSTENQVDRQIQGRQTRAAQLHTSASLPFWRCWGARLKPGL